MADRDLPKKYPFVRNSRWLVSGTHAFFGETKKDIYNPKKTNFEDSVINLIGYIIGFYAEKG